MAVKTPQLGSRSIVLVVNYGASGPWGEALMGRVPSLTGQHWSAWLHKHPSGLVLAAVLYPQQTSSIAVQLMWQEDQHKFLPEVLFA